MGQETILRQIALASYGTRFLRGEMALDGFARHGLFEGIASQFREGGKPDLLAGDFTAWLTLQRDAGAQRLSLHLLASLAVDPQPRTYPHEPALVVHFADCYQVWRTQCDDHVLDLYWTVATVTGVLEVPLTDWTALMSAVRRDLDIPANRPPHKPYLSPWWEQPEALKMPVFPYTSAFYLPHQLMEMLSTQAAQASNDMNGKNENSAYYCMGEQAAAEMDDWAARLHCWILEVQLRCANEVRTGDVTADDAPLVRLVAPPPAQGAPAPADVLATDQAPVSTATPAPVSLWASVLGLLSGHQGKDK
ncbi:MAG: hypothetical protein WKG03_16580 [Telluria sp.]